MSTTGRDGPTGNAVLEVEHLHKRYGAHVAVEDVSFTVEEGEIFGILGRKGAGKTTTVECIQGLRQPDGGCIRVLGRRVRMMHRTDSDRAVPSRPALSRREQVLLAMVVLTFVHHTTRSSGATTAAGVYPRRDPVSALPTSQKGDDHAA